MQPHHAHARVPPYAPRVRVRCAFCPVLAPLGVFDQAIFRATGLWVCAECVEEKLDGLCREEALGHGL